jgi:hypothetical protein
MTIIQLVVLLVVLGVVMYCVNNYIPLDPKFKLAINVIVAISLCLYLLQLFGILPAFSGVRIGR